MKGVSSKSEIRTPNYPDPEPSTRAFYPTTYAQNQPKLRWVPERRPTY